MNVRRLGAGAAAIAIASGAGLLISAGSGGAATPPPPTPITLNLTGLASSACPLPLNGSMAIKPGTTVLLSNDVLLGALSTEKVTITPAPDSTDPKSSRTIDPIGTAGSKVAFNRAATYSLSWQTKTLSNVPLVPPVLSATQKGKLIINASAQKCVVAVQVPVPSVSVPGVPSSVTGPINGAVSSAANTINGALGPVNGAVGGVLGQVNGAVGGVTGGLTGGGAAGGGGGKPGAGSSGPGTIYKPTGPTVADRTVPKGYGNGSGLGGVFVGSNGQSINAPSIGFAGSNGKTSGSATKSAVKSGGSPNTVDLASKQPRSALAALPMLAVIAAVIALSGATAFYARTFLLHRSSGAAAASAKA